LDIAGLRNISTDGFKSSLIYADKEMT